MSSYKKIINNLIKRKLTVSVAESCSGGELSKLFTEISGISNIFSMGLITYSNKEYEEQAIYFEKNKNKILNIKNKIKKSKKKNNLYDIKKYTHKLEQSFEKIHLLRLENKKPSNLDIS